MAENKSAATKNYKSIFINTLSWGIVLWLFGYILGIIFYMFLPKTVLGWATMPLGIAAMLFLLLKMIKRDSFKCYFGIAVVWTIIAIVFDYIFLVKLFNSTGYYKLDVYLYYCLTFCLPLLVGWYKFIYHPGTSKKI